MFWAILFSVWGGFLLGVIFMAILFMAREEQPKKSEQHRLEVLPSTKPTTVPAPKPKIKAIHG